MIPEYIVCLTAIHFSFLDRHTMENRGFDVDKDNNQQRNENGTKTGVGHGHIDEEKQDGVDPAINDEFDSNATQVGEQNVAPVSSETMATLSTVERDELSTTVKPPTSSEWQKSSANMASGNKVENGVTIQSYQKNNNGTMNNAFMADDSCIEELKHSHKRQRFRKAKKQTAMPTETSISMQVLHGTMPKDQAVGNEMQGKDNGIILRPMDLVSQGNVLFSLHYPNKPML